MKLTPIIAQLRSTSPLKTSDLRPSRNSSQAYHAQMMVNIVKILSKYVPGFSHLQNHAEF
jgi:hypothetical protein